MTINKICILGGSGFVGTHIVSQLSSTGKQVKVLTRRKERGKHLTVLPNVEVVEANVHDQQELEAQFKDCEAVINLVGILNERQHNGEGFRLAHIELPRKALNAAHQCNVSRILHMGALNADANSSPSRYLRSKGEGENQMHAFAGDIQVTSFRPSVIFGAEDSFFNRFASFLKLSPLMFPLACPNTRFAPAYVQDVAACFVDALEDKSTFGQRYDLCGPNEYTLRQLVEYTAENLGLRSKIIGLPDILSQLQALLLEWWPGKPFSLDNYQSLQVNSVCQDGIKLPTAVESIVPYYLGPREHRSIQNLQRQQARR